jgi:hypothetical protein
VGNRRWCRPSRRLRVCGLCDGINPVRAVRHPNQGPGRALPAELGHSRVIPHRAPSPKADVSDPHQRLPDYVHFRVHRQRNRLIPWPPSTRAHFSGSVLMLLGSVVALVLGVERHSDVANSTKTRHGIGKSRGGPDWAPYMSQASTSPAASQPVDRTVPASQRRRAGKGWAGSDSGPDLPA